MSKSTRCDNPMCSCDPCTCDDCACGGARLGELERRVMGILWQKPGGELTGRDVADVLSGNAYTTVATVLDRLVRKGLVRRRMDGRIIRFSAVGSQGAHAAVLMRQAMAVGTDTDAALVSFARTLSPSEAATLRGALDTVVLEPADSTS
ncbi:MAG: BlaI/MecI/CopY family transcriptional regulator [Acidimicrobiales bacterium]